MFAESDRTSVWRRNADSTRWLVIFSLGGQFIVCSGAGGCSEPEPPASSSSPVPPPTSGSSTAVKAADTTPEPLVNATAEPTVGVSSRVTSVAPSGATSHNPASLGMTGLAAPFTGAYSGTADESSTPAGIASIDVQASSSGESIGSGETSDLVNDSLFPSGVTTPKILIVGDSISAGPGCYKMHLDRKLTNSGITNYEFVGEYTDDCGGGVMHGAVSCATTADYSKASFTLSQMGCPTGERLGMGPMTAKYRPDLILLQLGVNDVWGGGQNIETILENYELLVEQARASNPNVVVAVAQIHQIKTVGGCIEPKTADPTAQALVDAVPAWAQRVTQPTAPVLVADLWTNSDVSESDDCVHPNPAGAERMAENWYRVLAPLLR